jgi:hypothetical protein
MKNAPRLSIHVAQEDIDRAVRRDSSHCMFAEAIRATLPWASRVAVDLQSIRFSDPRNRVRYIYLTPRPVQIALIQFDRGENPKPLTFELVNGQVTAMRDRSPDEQEYDRKRMKIQRSLEVKRLVAGPGGGAVPEVRGGKPPPIGPLAGGALPGMDIGRRRSFGLRALDAIR